MAYGKIARLPRELREQVNRRLVDNEPGNQLVAWLNGLPEVQAVLAGHFGGREINEGNISEWKKAGHQTWLAQQELRQCARDLAEDGNDLKAELEGVLTEHLSLVVAARYAQLLRGWNGEADEGFMKKLKGLKSLCQDVAVLRRGDHRAERLELNQKKFEQTTKDENIKALACCLEESKEYPEVAEAYRDAYFLLKAYKNGEKKNRDYEAKQRQREAAKREVASRHGPMGDGGGAEMKIEETFNSQHSTPNFQGRAKARVPGGTAAMTNDGMTNGAVESCGEVLADGQHVGGGEPGGNPGESDLIQPDERVEERTATDDRWERAREGLRRLSGEPPRANGGGENEANEESDKIRVHGS